MYGNWNYDGIERRAICAIEMKSFYYKKSIQDRTCEGCFCHLLLLCGAFLDLFKKIGGKSKSKCKCKLCYVKKSLLFYKLSNAIW